LHAFKVSDGLYTECLIKELKLVSGLHELAVTVADAEQEEEEEETKVIESKEQTESPVAESDVDSAAAEDEDDDMDDEALPSTPRLDVEESDNEGARGNKHVNTVDSCVGARPLLVACASG
jgi:hypothetical protein